MRDGISHPCIKQVKLHSGLLRFWTSFVFLYSQEHDVFGNSICFRPQLKGWMYPLQRADLGHCTLIYVRWPRLGLSNVPNRVGTPPIISPEDGRRSSFRNVLFRIPDNWPYTIADFGRSDVGWLGGQSVSYLVRELLNWLICWLESWLTEQKTWSLP
jgi:hypothetical protein